MGVLEIEGSLTSDSWCALARLVAALRLAVA